MFAGFLCMWEVSPCIAFCYKELLVFFFHLWCMSASSSTCGKKMVQAELYVSNPVCVFGGTSFRWLEFRHPADMHARLSNRNTVLQLEKLQQLHRTKLEWLCGSIRSSRCVWFTWVICRNWVLFSERTQFCLIIINVIMQILYLALISNAILRCCTTEN